MAFTVSHHALEKHLYYPDFFQGASAFFDSETMMESIQACLDKPDTITTDTQRTRLEKDFNFSIGFKGYGKGEKFSDKSRVSKTSKSRHNGIPYLNDVQQV